MTDGASQRIDDRTITEIRDKVSLVSLVSRRVKLTRAGRGYKGLCPFHLEKTASFTVTDEKQFYHCHGCGAHGDCFRWIQEVDGVGFRAAVVALADHAGVPLVLAVGDRRHDSAALDGRKRAAITPIEAREAQASEFISSSTAGRWMWQSASPARGSLVERWLESRSLNPLANFDGARFAIDHLRFHPRCPVSVWRAWEHPEDSRRTAPAMILANRDRDGLVRGVHVTFLRGDGRAMADFGLGRDGHKRKARKIFGKIGGCAVFLSSPDMIADRSLPLLVGEGFETTWSFAQGFGRRARVAATLNLKNIEGYPVKLRDGSIPLWNIAADPERPPFVIPDAGEVVIAVDADMKPLRRQKVQLTRGAKPVLADINGLQRAEICASLAVQAWRRAGATRVGAVRPRMGNDFNDEACAA